MKMSATLREKWKAVRTPGTKSFLISVIVMLAAGLLMIIADYAGWITGTIFGRSGVFDIFLSLGGALTGFGIMGILRYRNALKTRAGLVLSIILFVVGVFLSLGSELTGWIPSKSHSLGTTITVAAVFGILCFIYQEDNAEKKTCDEKKEEIS